MHRLESAQDDNRAAERPDRRCCDDQASGDKDHCQAWQPAFAGREIDRQRIEDHAGEHHDSDEEPRLADV